MVGELFRRRVPQIVGLYMVGSWGFVEAVDWAVEQYVLSPHITDFVVALLLLLLPSVLLLAENTWALRPRGFSSRTRQGTQSSA
jgi:hypothetical protein